MGRPLPDADTGWLDPGFDAERLADLMMGFTILSAAPDQIVVAAVTARPPLASHLTVLSGLSMVRSSLPAVSDTALCCRWP